MMPLSELRAQRVGPVYEKSRFELVRGILLQTAKVAAFGIQC
jgi:hypothetical protein